MSRLSVQSQVANRSPRFQGLMPPAKSFYPYQPVLPLPVDAFVRASQSVQTPVASTVASNETPLRIVYHNDIHEKFQLEPNIITALNTEGAKGRQSGKDVLTLNAGDNNVGREPDELMLTVRMMNQAHYDGVTMGNHELDSGSKGYANALWQANFPTLLSNLEVEPGTSLSQLMQAGRIQTQPRIINNAHGTYGLIGVTTPELHEVVSSTAKLEGEEAEDLNETIQVVQSQVNDLQRKGVNKIVLLSHMGLNADRQLAQRVQGIDVIVGGHTHEVINGVTPGYNLVTGPGGDPVLILQAGKNGQWIGVSDVNFDASGRIKTSQNQLVNPALYPADLQATALRDSVLGIPKPIAVMGTSYDCNENEYHSDAVAQFAADSVRRMTGADIAIARSTQLRSNFEPGVFTDQDLKALMPFTDSMMMLPIRGAELIEAFNRAGQGLVKHQSHPGMLDASGLRVTMDSRTGQLREAFVQNKLGQWEPLNPNQTYRVIIDQFAIFNHEWPSLAHPDRVIWNSNQPLRYFFEQGLRQAGVGGQAVRFQDDGRLNII